MRGLDTRRLIAIAAVASVILTAVPPASGADEAVDALIGRGVELRRQGKQFEALEIFQRAHAIAPSARTFGQMGLAEVSLQRWLDADEHLAAALAAAADPWTRKNQVVLEQGAASARSHISELSIDGPAGAEMSVAGKTVGVLPLPQAVKVLPGEVVVRARFAGFRPFETKATVQGGQHAVIVVRLEPVPIAAPSPPQPASLVAPLVLSSEPAGRRRTWRTWTGAGLGAVGLGSIVFGTTWIIVDGRPSCSPPPGAVCELVYDTKTWGTIALGAGVLAAGVATYLFLSDRH